MDDDGLLMRESGEWIKRKHHYLDRYCDMFTKAMKGKWHRIYLDPMAGPGRCRIKGSGEITPGSPFVALERDFDEYRFYEADRELADALRGRVATHPKADRCQVVQANWIEAVTSPGFRLPDRSLTLAFVDPTGISQVPWTAVRALARSSNRIDIMFTIQHALGISWNAHQYLASTTDRTAVDGFAGSGGWRDRLGPTTSVREALIAEFVENMGACGFETRKWQLVTMPSGVGLYYLCLFSRSQLALRFWDEVVVKDEAGQRSFRFED
jgi:three-Cys-motif partner protein